MNKRTESKQLTGNTYAVYNKNDGTIVHLHSCFTIPGKPAASRNDQEKESLDFAVKFSKKASDKLAVLIIPKERLSAQIEYKVDIKTKTLVGKPRRKER